MRMGRGVADMSHPASILGRRGVANVVWGLCVLDELDAAAVREWGREAVAALEAQQVAIDRLNVFPVADRDTGTNLAITLRAAAAALDHTSADDAGTALLALARGAVLGASGNSGNIVAQVLQALAGAAAGAATLTAAGLREGLCRGAVEARSAVAEPVEGTVLSVADAAAAAVCGDVATLGELAQRALAAATDALARTPQQLSVLAEAGVVDAGAQGYVLLLESLVRVVGGSVAVRPALDPPAADPVAQPVGRHADYEVQYLLDAPGGFDPAELRRGLVGIGESVVVVGTGTGTWSVHVHTDDAGAAVELGIGAGRPYRISVVRLAEAEPGEVGPGQARVDQGAAAGPTVVLAVTADESLARLLAGEGVTVVPGAGEIVARLGAADPGAVVLLPGDADTRAGCEAAAEQLRARGRRAAVVPAGAAVQTLAAIAVHDPSRHFDDDVIAMAEAAAATRYAEVTVAEGSSLTSAGICQAGDVLGWIDGEVVHIGHGLLSVTLTLVDRLLGVGAELVTVLVDAAAHPGVGEIVRQHVLDRSPYTEVCVYDVTLAGHPLVLGVE